MTDEKDRRRLIVGSASTYRPHQLRPFVESLRASGYAGDVIIMTTFWNWELKSYLRRHAVTPMTIWPMRSLHGPAAPYPYQVYARLPRSPREPYHQMMF